MGDYFFVSGIIARDRIVVDDRRFGITPQPQPTTPRIKELLSKGLLAPESLTPTEVQEMTASVVYHLIMSKKH